jgi:hypothetical protein
MGTPSHTPARPAALLEAVGGDRAMFQKLSEIFFRDCGLKFAALKQAFEAGDRQAIGFHSHALKSTVGPMAATKLLGMLQALEQECEHPGPPCEMARLNTIKAELHAVADAVRHFGGQL